jgi:hypothetical protein
VRRDPVEAVDPERAHRAEITLVRPIHQVRAFAAAFFGVDSGNNGKCNPAYLCTAGVGYNGPGGVGTPDGVSGL